MPPPSRLLDLTRLVSRAGRGAPTGIDRVELAYLEALQQQPEPVFALVRSVAGFLLLDPRGVAALAARLTGERPLDARDLLGWLFVRDGLRARAEATARRLATDRCRPSGLARMIRRQIPAGSSYFNVGHSNLDPAVMAALRDGGIGKIAVFLHDTIPLDFPEFARPGTVEPFRRKFDAATGSADILIANSRATADDIGRHAKPGGNRAPVVVSHLGLYAMAKTVEPLPHGLPPERPFFVVIGTVEPRKNHAFLLDLWDTMARQTPAEDMPALVIAGRKGWNSDAFFRRLSRSPHYGTLLHHMANLSDDALACVVRQSAGVLCPSFAEGFGLPAAEAAAAGVPLICNNLPVYREYLDDYPIYAGVDDSYPWLKSLAELTEKKRGRKRSAAERPLTPVLPCWEDHFNTVLSQA